MGDLEWDLLDAFNSRRIAENLSPLTMDRQLAPLAAIRAQECTQAASGTRPDGRDWSTILTDYQYGYRSYTQEIRIHCSKGFPVDILVDTWMSSGSSRDSILSSSAECCGIGVAYSGNTMYIVVLFVG